MGKDKSHQSKYGTISLPLPLIESVKKKIDGTGIHSVSAYVTFILRQILSSSEQEKILDKKTEAEIKVRLKNLGYI